MNKPANPAAENSRFGLCSRCQHARLIESAKGSQFLLCQLSQSNPAFAKYPRLPVFACTGYQPNAAR